MDKVTELDSYIAKLKDLKNRLSKEIDSIRSEIDQVENDALGMFNRVKALVAAQVMRQSGFETVLSESYSRAKNKEFKSAQEYLDHLHESISEIRGYISKIDQVVANLEKTKRDIEYQVNTASTWINKAKDLLN